MMTFLPIDAKTRAIALVRTVIEQAEGTLTNQEILYLTEAITQDLKELDAQRAKAAAEPGAFPR